jgi:hypothetical protein
MPSAVIENLRTQFLLSLGLNEYTPIPPEAEADLQDRWEQYLYAAAGGGGIAGPGAGGSVWQPAPPRRVGLPAKFVPDEARAKYEPGKTYVIGSGTYVGPPTPGSVTGPGTGTGGARTTTPTASKTAPRATAGGGGGTFQAPPGRR